MTYPNLENKIIEQATRAAEIIQQADALIIATGAGMGVDSGLPNFRSDAGFWRAYPALQKAQIPAADKIKRQA